jgi:AcrR family transcriptional regulator
MDLRQKKTLRAIAQAFYALRKQKKLEAITVTELCQCAEISKATFYLHYRDIFDLSEKMQNEVIDSVFSKLENPMEVLTNSRRFMQSFVLAVEQESERIPIIFSDSQAGALPVRILQHLKEYIFIYAPQLRDDPKIQVYLTYHVMGGYYACMERPDGLGYKQVLEILEKISPPVMD